MLPKFKKKCRENQSKGDTPMIGRSRRHRIIYLYLLDDISSVPHEHPVYAYRKR